MTSQMEYFTMSMKDVEQGKAFFSALFGWRFEPAAEKRTHRYVHVADSKPAFGLSDLGGPAVRLYFTVEDVEAAAARVRGLGGQVDDFGTSEAGDYAECRDDQGTHFSLWQPAPGYA